MRASGVSPDVTTYNVAIAACQRAGRWETAGALQAGRDAVGGRPEWPENLLAFNAALRRHDVRSRQVSSKVSSKVSSPPVVRTSPPVMLIASDRPSVAALVPVIGDITGTIASTSPSSAEDSAVSPVGGGLARRRTGRNV